MTLMGAYSGPTATTRTTNEGESDNIDKRTWMSAHVVFDASTWSMSGQILGWACARLSLRSPRHERRTLSSTTQNSGCFRNE